ncbi:MAG: hypothetical protein JJE55_13100 [Flavobacteriaceae bacterium]|nr:hypothetical protein [Flavobacteriaceae bacterium]
MTHEYYGELEVWNDIYDGSIDTDIAIYGSSRAWVDISPKILKDSLNLKAYNFGLDGHNFWLQYLRHLEYIEYNPHPKHILLAVDYNSIQKRKNLYLYEQFLPYMLWNDNIKYYTNSYEGFSTYDYYIPLLRYAGKSTQLKEAFEPRNTQTKGKAYRKRGYKGVEKQWSTDFEKAKSNLKEYYINIDQGSLNLLDKFLLECKTNGTTVSLIYTPEYIEGQKFIKNRDTIIKIYQNFAKEYNIPFLDYSMDSICFNKDYFYNAIHLNKKGSELFSKTLSKDLKDVVDIQQLQN